MGRDRETRKKISVRGSIGITRKWASQEVVHGRWGIRKTSNPMSFNERLNLREMSPTLASVWIRRTCYRCPVASAAEHGNSAEHPEGQKR